VAVDPWTFDIDIGALMALGSLAALMFWRLLNRMEKKVDHVVDHMVTKRECDLRHSRMEQDFNTHYHIPDDGVGIIKR